MSMIMHAVCLTSSPSELDPDSTGGRWLPFSYSIVNVDLQEVPAQRGVEFQISPACVYR